MIDFIVVEIYIIFQMFSLPTTRLKGFYNLSAATYQAREDLDRLPFL